MSLISVALLVVSMWPAPSHSESTQPPAYNPSLLSWSLATSSAEWEPRDSAASFVFQNKLWTMGGLDGNGHVVGKQTVEYWKAPHFNDIWASDDGVSWTLMQKEAAWPPRRSMSVVEFQNKLWMFGGWSPITGYTNDIWESLDGITWTRVADAPWPSREGQAVEIFQGKIWMMGGVEYDARETKNDVWYSENGTEWHEATTTIPWSPRWDHATAVFDGKLFLAGGMDLEHHIFKDVWVSKDGLEWNLLTSNPPWESRQGFGLLSFKGYLWLVGRLNDETAGGVNDTWYSKDGISWRKTLTNPGWTGREDHAALVFKGKMYVFGGMDKNWEWRNDVWTAN